MKFKHSELNYLSSCPAAIRLVIKGLRDRLSDSKYTDLFRRLTQNRIDELENHLKYLKQRSHIDRASGTKSKTTNRPSPYEYLLTQKSKPVSSKPVAPFTIQKYGAGWVILDSENKMCGKDIVWVSNQDAIDDPFKHRLDATSFFYDLTHNYSASPVNLLSV